MKAPIQGELKAGEFKYGLIVSRFNDVITRRLLEGAIDCLERHGASEDQYEIIYCPGAYELPLMARHVLDTEKYDALVCMGAVVRGDTPHFDYIAAEVTKGLAQLSLETRVPVSFGVLTTDNTQQALERAGLKQGNKGWEAALTAMEMVHVISRVKKL
ncbi:MAG: 6,7-dimethyl-8-ribityllumazine synthase [Ectothiorhodospiraceae bacterium]|nr:6,7-dimethyl-8-ribityllumazine synthase [Ectothiorhodospiraceae bacterium]